MIQYRSQGGIEMTLQIETPDKETLSSICKKYHIRKLAIFGSALRNDFGPDNNIDILVEFDSKHVPGFFKLIDIQDELSLLFKQPVDLRTPEDLSRYFREDVIENAEVQYAEG